MNRQLTDEETQLTNKHIERCSYSSSLAKVIKQTTSSFEANLKKNSYTNLWECRLIQLLQGAIYRLVEWKMSMSYQPVFWLETGGYTQI